MEAPKWNEQEKAGSLERWISMLNEEARYKFLEMGTHVEIFFLFNDTGLIEIVPIVGTEKEATVLALKHMMTARNGYAFIHISEGTMRPIDSADQVDLLLVHAESREGLGVAYCSTVVPHGEKKMLMDAVQISGSKLSGPFTGIFQAQ